MFFRIVRDDFRKVKADAIVINADSNSLPVVCQGIKHAIYKAVGNKKLMKAREKIGNIAVGEAAITKVFSLKAKYIIHTVFPVLRGSNGDERALLRRCYENSLKLAASHNCKSIVFPLIFSGEFDLPKQEAVEIAIAVFKEFLDSNSIEIMLVLFDDDSFKLSKGIFGEVDSYLNDHYEEKGPQEEYPGIEATTLFLAEKDFGDICNLEASFKPFNETTSYRSRYSKNQTRK